MKFWCRSLLVSIQPVSREKPLVLALSGKGHTIHCGHNSVINVGIRSCLGLATRHNRTNINTTCSCRYAVTRSVSMLRLTNIVFQNQRVEFYAILLALTRPFWIDPKVYSDWARQRHYDGIKHYALVLEHSHVSQSEHSNRTRRVIILWDAVVLTLARLVWIDPNYDWLFNADYTVKPTQSQMSLVVSDIVLKIKFAIKRYETVLYTCNIWYLNEINENSD